MSQTILMIDDDPDFIAINKSVLEKAGYTVETAFDGNDGLKKLETVKPSLIILDVMMKTQDEGFHVAKAIREKEAFKNTPILMLSGMNTLENNTWQLGPDEKWNPIDVFLDKPVKSEVLLKKVKHLLDR